MEKPQKQNNDGSHSASQTIVDKYGGHVYAS
jgi:hypothetical protein